MVDGNLHFRICAEGCKFKNNPNVYYTPTNWNWDTAIRFRCGFSAFILKIENNFNYLIISNCVTKQKNHHL